MVQKEIQWRGSLQVSWGNITADIATFVGSLTLVAELPELQGVEEVLSAVEGRKAWR